LEFLWPFENISLIDIIDILLLAYMLYRALLILQGTRAFQSLAGLLFLVLFYSASRSLGLNSVYWMLDKFFVYLVLAIIILFQEDIRRGLARAGDFLPNFQTSQDVAIEDVIRTTYSLAARRIGALIALEREASLEEYISAGTQMDSMISQELLTAIFLPTSPLHDGAIIIRHGRIAAAQCFIPISVSKSLSKIYGTRHRAAIGLTEDTDAAVIAISEERGTVSLAINGEIEIMTSNNELRQRLQELFSAKAAGGQR
jgi:diadenylate cyclase